MKDCFDITGKVALVTGASSGLGAEFSKILAYRGADVVMLARRKEKLEKNGRRSQAVWSQGAADHLRCDR